MKEIRRIGLSTVGEEYNRAATEFTGTEAERLAFDLSTAVPGDKFHVHEEGTEIMVDSWFFAETLWCKYHTYTL